MSAEIVDSWDAGAPPCSGDDEGKVSNDVLDWNSDSSDTREKSNKASNKSRKKSSKKKAANRDCLGEPDEWFDEYKIVDTIKNNIENNKRIHTRLSNVVSEDKHDSFYTLKALGDVRALLALLDRDKNVLDPKVCPISVT